MTTPPKTMEEIKNAEAILRSKRQCTTGQKDLDAAISWYLKIGFEDGFNFRDRLDNEALKIAVEALEFYDEGFHYEMPDSGNEFTVPTLVENGDIATQALAEIRKLRGEG